MINRFDTSFRISWDGYFWSQYYDSHMRYHTIKGVLIQLINKVNYNLCDNIKLGIYKLYDL